MSCIDHVYTNSKLRCSNVSVTPFGNSDHELVGYIRYLKDPPSPSRMIRRRSYKDFNSTDFLSGLRKVDRSSVYLCQDVDLAVVVFTNMFKQILDLHAPWVRFQQRKRFSPWVSIETAELIKKRDEAKAHASAQAKLGQRESEAWKNYKNLRNKINNKLKYEENEYKKKIMQKSLESPSDCWKNAKKFMNWKSDSGPPSQLSIDGILVSKASLIASQLNHFFIRKVNDIREALVSVPNNLSKCYTIMRGKKCKLWIQHISVEKVRRLLKSLKNSKSISLDELDNFSVKLSAEIIANPLHHIITLSLMDCKFPTSWKFSKVVPLHKKDSRLEMSNYRPVTILSPLSKILEKCMYEQIYQYFSRNNLFRPHLHGYRLHRSTQTALLTMYDSWVRTAAIGQLSGTVFIDLSAAFDLVDHRLLLSKLKIYGVQEDVLEWISSYLLGRFQAVWIDHIFSDFLPLTVGVPQGSNLRPLLFLVFFNDLPYHIKSSIESYADDTTISAAGTTLVEIEDKLNIDCENISNWMKSNKMKLNVGKTHILCMGTQRRLALRTKPLEVFMDGSLLNEDPSGSEKLLGVTIESDLKWSKHIAQLCSKLKKRLSGLRQLRYSCPYILRKKVAEGLFNSVLVYCLPLLVAWIGDSCLMFKFSKVKQLV